MFLSVLFDNNNKKPLSYFPSFFLNEQLCVLDCHNSFSLIFCNSFINILPSLLVIVIIAVDGQLVPLIINAGCTGKDVTDTD